MKRGINTKFSDAFTIVELLIVIVVIAILAGITIVAYSGITHQAKISTVLADLDGASKQLKIDQVNGGTYPASTSAANNGNGLKASSGTTYQYTVNNAVTPQTFCLTATNGDVGYYITDNSAPVEGVCPGDSLPGAPVLSWTAQTGAGSRLWKAVASSSDGTKLVAVDNTPGYIYTSTDSGSTWTARTVAGSRTWGAIYSSSDGTKLVAGDTNGYSGGYLYTSTDSGATWTQRTGAGTSTWYNIVGSSDGTKLAASAEGGGYLYTSTDSGVTWTEQTAAGTKSWDSIASSSDGTKLIAGDEDAYLYTSTDSGATWTQRTGAGVGDWYGITSSSDGTKLMAADYVDIAGGDYSGGYIYTSTDSGATWTQHTSFGKHPWVSAAASSDGSKLIVTTLFSDTIATSSDGGSTWAIGTGPVGYAIQKDIASSSDGTKIISFGDVTSYSSPGYIQIGSYH